MGVGGWEKEGEGEHSSVGDGDLVLLLSLLAVSFFLSDLRQRWLAAVVGGPVQSWRTPFSRRISWKRVSHTVRHTVQFVGGEEGARMR